MPAEPRDGAAPGGSATRAWPSWARTLPRAGPDAGRRAEGGRRLSAAAAGAGTAATPRIAQDGPLVSYVTVVRNARETLARTLRSVREQRWPHIEHIVVDGLSDDGTLQVIEQHAAQIDYYVSERDAGLYDALNKAIPLAGGELVCVLNADDWLTPDAAELAARAYLRSPGGACMVLSAAWAMEGGRQILWSPGRLDAGSWLRCASVCHNGVYANRAAYEASGPYSTTLPIAADFRWLMACVDAGVPRIVVDEPTVHYSVGGMSSDFRRHLADCARILCERFEFLQESDAWGLIHAFHLYRDHLPLVADSRPAHLGRFLDGIARAHGADPGFAQALALAGCSTLQHPEDASPPGRLTRAEKRSRSLHKRWMALRALLRR